ncbi:protein of unknown function [Pararobbsia alpina]
MSEYRATVLVLPRTRRRSLYQQDAPVLKTAQRADLPAHVGRALTASTLRTLAFNFAGLISCV